MDNRINFTKRRLESLPPAPEGTRVTYHDAVTPALQLRVTHTSGKTFYMRRRIDGQSERVKLGTFPQMTVEQARRQVAELNGAIAKGANPAEVKRVAKEEPTFGEVFEHFIRHKRNRAGQPLSARTVEEYRKVIDTHAAGLKNEKLSKITPERLKMLHKGVSSPAQANKVKAIISTVFNYARQEGITALPNPSAALKNKFIPSRERFLLPSELPRFFAAVAESPLADFFLLGILTGARRSNVQAMRWVDIDQAEAVWRIPMTKNGLPQTVPLPPEAVAILERRKTEAVHGEAFVFPGPGKTGHLVEPKWAWGAVLQSAGITNLRVHDLRRTLGSWQARQGASLAIIGKSLGHKTHQATAVYARLDLDPVRQSVESATAAMFEAGGIKEPAQIIPIRRKASA
ncbi:MAG: tyrosine-type recombinase/integrase [Methylococcus sp.]|nr:tyrosine-type recombinase/integrase [Methylococcus sp.]